jgi:hypothetical protein
MAHISATYPESMNFLEHCSGSPLYECCFATNLYLLSRDSTIYYQNVSIIKNKGKQYCDLHQDKSIVSGNQGHAA